MYFIGVSSDGSVAKEIGLADEDTKIPPHPLPRPLRFPVSAELARFRNLAGSCPDDESGQNQWRGGR